MFAGVVVMMLGKHGTFHAENFSASLSLASCRRGATFDYPFGSTSSSKNVSNNQTVLHKIEDLTLAGFFRWLAEVVGFRRLCKEATKVLRNGKPKC